MTSCCSLYPALLFFGIAHHGLFSFIQDNKTSLKGAFACCEESNGGKFIPGKAETEEFRDHHSCVLVRKHGQMRLGRLSLFISDLEVEI